MKQLATLELNWWTKLSTKPRQSAISIWSSCVAPGSDTMLSPKKLLHLWTKVSPRFSPSWAAGPGGWAAVLDLGMIEHIRATALGKGCTKPKNAPNICASWRFNVIFVTPPEKKPTNLKIEALLSDTVNRSSRQSCILQRKSVSLSDKEQIYVTIWMTTIFPSTCGIFSNVIKKVSAH